MLLGVIGNALSLSTSLKNGAKYRMAQQTKEKTGKQITLNAYPNPSNDRLTVNLFNGIEYLAIKRLEIYNLMGQLIYKTSNTSNEINLSLKSENISSGILLVKVLDANNHSFQTCIIYEK